MAMKKDMNVLAVGLDRATNTLEPFAVSATGELTASSNIDSIATPTGAPIVGQVAIAVTGTAVRLSAVSVVLPGGSLLVCALAGNSAAGTCGGSTVTDDVDGTGNGLIIEAGDTRVVFASDLSDVYVNGTAGDIFTWSAG